MKVLTSIVTVFLLLLVAAAAALLYLGGFASSEQSRSSVHQRFQSALKQMTPEARVGFFSELPEDIQSRIDPAKVLPQSLNYRRSDMLALVSFMESCTAPKEHPSKDRRIAKAMRFTALLCEGAGPENIDPSFFKSGPFIHPLGHSYVYRAHAAFPGQFNDAWLKETRSYLHLSEFKKMFPTERPPFLPESVNQSDLRPWTSGVLLFGTGDFLWASSSFLGSTIERRHIEGGGVPSEQSYQVFSIRDVRSKLVSSGLFLRSDLATNDLENRCLVTGPHICVGVDDKVIQWRELLLQAVLILASILALILVTMLVLWSFNKTRLRKERLFGLQSLSHQLRTPVTSMSLSLELLRGEFDALSENAQAGFLRLVDDHRRLLRLVEGSRRYLSAERLPRYQKEAIPLSSFLEKISEPFQDQVQLFSQAEGVDVLSDPYWLGICVTNLIENACKHGKPPISIYARKSHNGAVVSISDLGQLSSRMFQHLRTEFRRGPESDGTGLGLSIVEKTLAKLGHKFSFSEQPTTFTIEFKG